MDNKVEKEVCDVQHRALEHRMDRLEIDMTALEASLDKNLQRIFEKLDAFGKRPSWIVLTIISFLSTLSFTTLSILFKWGHG